MRKDMGLLGGEDRLCNSHNTKEVPIVRFSEGHWHYGFLSFAVGKWRYSTVADLANSSKLILPSAT